MRMILLLVLGVMCGGCQIAGLPPLYKQRDKVQDSRLEGVWILEREGEEGSLGLATIRPLMNGSYSLVMTSEGNTEPGAEPRAPLELQATLVRLGGQLHMDVEAPPEELAESVGAYALFVLPIHYYFRLEISDDTLSLAMLSVPWMEELLKADPHAASYIRPGAGESYIVDGEKKVEGLWFRPPVLLTGSTGDVQKFIAGDASVPEAWSHLETYRKFQSLLPDDGEE